MNQLLEYKKIHCIGIGGAGLSALARILKENNIDIGGSDIEDSPVITELKIMGITVIIGHNSTNISQDTDLIIYSPAIPSDNVELIAAAEKNIDVLTYPEALGLLTKQFDTIAVCGTHGKTTTTAMIAKTLIENNADPTVLIGSNIAELNNQNARVGNSNYFLIEACEYKRSFLSYFPKYIVLTNIDLDHLDYFNDEQDYKNAYVEFIKRLPPNGILIANQDDLLVQAVLNETSFPNTITFGTSVCSDFQLLNHTIHIEGQEQGKLELNIAGKHNLMNALAAFTMSRVLDLDTDVTLNALNSFDGASRRFEIKGKTGNTTIIDDYAHHPTEIKATLNAARAKFGTDKNIICIFQPHQYNRTHKFLEAFGKSFKDADEVIIPNIYKVRDSKQDEQQVSAEKLVEEINKHHSNARYGNGLENTLQTIKERNGEPNIVITMGAGDIWQLANDLSS